MDNKKEFIGELESALPELLIDQKNKKDIQSFFLILGLIFNDLKGLIFFQKLIEETYRKPEVDETSAHAGEYGGLISQLDKLIIATVGEFFIFIEKNKSVINSPQFLLLLKKNKMHPYKRAWDDLIKLNKGSTILSKIARVRSNVAFHYDHSMEQLRKGYMNSFFRKEKDLPQHRHAYYSLGDTMEKTRLYYSDAAAQSYINSLIDLEDRAEIRKAVDGMNHVIQWLLKIYLDDIRK